MLKPSFNGLNPIVLYFPYQREDWKEESDDEAGDQLDGPVSPPPAWEAVVPQRGQQLLAVGLGHELRTERRKTECETCFLWNKGGRHSHQQSADESGFKSGSFIIPRRLFGVSC